MLAEVGDAIEILTRGIHGCQRRRSLIPSQALVERFVCFGKANHFLGTFGMMSSAPNLLKRIV
jgi:hypothetical protein